RNRAPPFAPRRARTSLRRVRRQGSYVPPRAAKSCCQCLSSNCTAQQVRPWSGPARHASEETSVKLYGFFRSSAAYRVRIALNLKKLPYAQSSVHLSRDGGWQWSKEYRAINPQKRVPALALSTGEILLQSLAIIEYLDEIEPEPPLLPADAIERAKVRAVSQI